MRHGKKFNHLSRKAAHREAMLSNMASSLIKHKRINTTVVKAKALRKYIEPIITKAKSDTTHSRRVVFSYLQDKDSVQELFGPVAEKVANRPGGYTRIIRTETRYGDAAELCMMELVDFNELLLEEKPSKKSRRSRRGGNKKKATEEASVTEQVVQDPTDIEGETSNVEVAEKVAEDETPEVSGGETEKESDDIEGEKK